MKGNLHLDTLCWIPSSALDIGFQPPSVVWLGLDWLVIWKTIDHISQTLSQLRSWMWLSFCLGSPVKLGRQKGGKAIFLRQLCLASVVLRHECFKTVVATGCSDPAPERPQRCGDISTEAFGMMGTAFLCLVTHLVELPDFSLQLQRWVPVPGVRTAPASHRVKWCSIVPCVKSHSPHSQLWGAQ